MTALIRYRWTLLFRRKSLWGCSLLILVLQLALEALVMPEYTVPAAGSWLAAITPSPDLLDRSLLAAGRMSLGACFMLLGATLGSVVLCPALRMNALLPVTAAGYTARQQVRACTLLVFALSILNILAVFLGEYLLFRRELQPIFSAAPSAMAAIAFTRLLLYLGNAGLGFLLCLPLGRCEVSLLLSQLFLVTEVIPNLPQLGVLLPSGALKLFFWSPQIGLQTAYILEAALIWLLCFLLCLKSRS